MHPYRPHLVGKLMAGASVDVYSIAHVPGSFCISRGRTNTPEDPIYDVYMGQHDASSCGAAPASRLQRHLGIPNIGGPQKKPNCTIVLIALGSSRAPVSYTAGPRGPRIIVMGIPNKGP